LLVSPATRTELVLGKFLTIWVFSAATALVNLGSMALTASGLGSQLSGDSFHPGILLWAVVLLMPLSAFFSAIALAVGAYARSTKEGQYYLMPLFLATMPLIFVTLLPGVELNPFYSMVPVTGVALLLQALTSVGTPDAKLWLYFIPVLLPMVLYSWLALRWAIGQFNREDVLFREAERLDLNLWVRHLFRAKEALPSVGQALCCFLLVLALRWLSFSVGTGWSLLVRTGISHLAFVITPPLIMAVMLTTRPLDGLGLHRLSLWAWPATVLLALVCMPPLAGLATFIIQQFPGLEALLYQYHPLTLELRALRDEPITSGMRMGYFLVLVVLPALSEELAFRGFILQGLRQHLSTGRAILLSGFLFAVYQMNVFQLVPHLLFGMILGILVVRTGSVLPGMLFHLVYNTLLLGPVIFPEALGWLASANLRSPPTLVNLVVLTTCAVVATGILLTMTRSGPQEKGGSG
jgi:sodium transport system permease protein